MLAPRYWSTPTGLNVSKSQNVEIGIFGTPDSPNEDQPLFNLAFGMAAELKAHNIAALALTPGFLRSEAMLEHMGTTEDAWQDGAAGDPHFMFSETPRYVGRGIAALAADPERLGLSGQVLSSWALADRYAVTDLDGSTPHWGRHAAEEDFGRDQRAGHRRFLAGFVGVPSAE